MSKSSVSRLPARTKPEAPLPTRRRLVDAAIEIVRGEGLGSLTTVEITRRAGIAQPGFYKYFRNVDECLEEATTQVLDGMRETFSAMRQGIKNRNDAEEVATHFLAVLDAVAADRPFNELIVRYRRDPSTLGRAISEVEKKVLTDYVEELWVATHAAGLGSEYRPRLTLLAELALGSLGSCIERVLDEPDVDRAELARHLAEFTIGGTRTVLGRLLGKDPTRKR